MEESPEPTKPKRETSFRKLSNLLQERWPEYVLEVVVIIFSITISFALDEWKDERHKQEVEQTYLKGLYSDIQTDTNQLKEIITETQHVIQKAASLSRFTPQRSGPTYAQFVGDIRYIFKRPRFIAEDATFSDLKSTGNMQVISSFPLKTSLFDYYRQYESIVQIEGAELETTNSIIGPYILRRFSLSSTVAPLSNANWVMITQEPEFQNAMLVRRSTREELLMNYQRVLKLGNTILAKIKLQLK